MGDPHEPLPVWDSRSGTQLLLLVVVAAGLSVLSPGYIGLGLAWLLAALIIHIVVHEAAHAVVAELVGFRATSITTGYGPRLLSFRVGTTMVTFRLVPLAGFVQVEPRRETLTGGTFTLRLALTYLVGPVASVGFFFAIPFVVGDAVLTQSIPGATEPVELPIANYLRWPVGIAVLAALFPRPQTDLWHVYHLTRRGRPLQRELDESRPTLLRLQEETDAINQALTEGDHRMAIERLELALTEPDLTRESRRLTANLLAWTCLQAGSTEDLERADRHLHELDRAGLVDSPSVLDTRAVLRLRQGRATEALEDMHRALADRRHPEVMEHEAALLVTRARCHVALGDGVGSREDFDRAIRLDPTVEGAAALARSVDVLSARAVLGYMAHGGTIRELLDTRRIDLLEGAARAVEDQASLSELDVPPLTGAESAAIRESLLG